MKNLTLFTLTILLVCFFACSKEDNKNNNSSTSNSTQGNFEGEYAGTIVGSTGAYTITFSKNNISAKLIFDGVEHLLTANQGMVKGSTVTIKDNEVSIAITVDDTGGTPVLDFNIPGHTIDYTITKSSKDKKARIYLGEFTNTENNKVVYRSTFNLTFGINNDFNIIDKLVYKTNDASSAFYDPNLVLGKVDKISGTYIETSNSVTCTYKVDSSNETMVFNKSGNTLTFNDNQGGKAIANLVE